MRSRLSLLLPKKWAHQSFSFSGNERFACKHVYHMDSHKEEKQTLESIIIPGNFLTMSPLWHQFLWLKGQNKSSVNLKHSVYTMLLQPLLRLMRTFPSESPIHLTTQTASFSTILLSWKLDSRQLTLGDLSRLPSRMLTCIFCSSVLWSLKAMSLNG